LQVLLPLERVMTLDMDGQGQEKGYKPGWAARVAQALRYLEK